MARKATVDVIKVLQMLEEGESTLSVAEHFGVSRQAIDLHRRKFIQSGKLGERRAPRRTVTLLEPAEAGIKDNQAFSAAQRYDAGRKGSPVVSPAKPADSGIKGAQPVSLDRLIELIIEAFDSLKQVPRLELEAKLEKYKRDYQIAAERIDILEKAVSKRNE